MSQTSRMRAHWGWSLLLATGALQGCFLNDDFELRAEANAATSSAPTVHPTGDATAATGTRSDPVPAATPLPPPTLGDVGDSESATGVDGGVTPQDTSHSVTEVEPLVTTPDTGASGAGAGDEQASTVSFRDASGGVFEPTGSGLPGSSPVDAGVFSRDASNSQSESPPDSCEATAVGGALIYDGNGGTDCDGGINPPRIGYWEAFSDGSGLAAELTPRAPGSRGGRAGARDCAMHAKGSDLVEWGGGTGFSLHEWDDTWCPYDASAYVGIELWIKGTTHGTYTANYVAQENTLRIQVKSGPRTDIDEYGFFCEINALQWSRCSALFTELEPEGWQADVPDFDQSWLRGVGIVAHTHDAGPAVSYDFWVDDISFF